MYAKPQIDGVNRWQQFLYLTLPNLKSALVPLSLLGFIWTFNMFNVIYLMTDGGPNIWFGEPGSTDILITYVYDVAFRDGSYGVAAAWSVVIFMMLIAFSWVYMKTNTGNGGGCMNKKSIFVDAYAPLELAYLRLWLTVSACMSIFLIFIEWLKENTIGMQLCFVGFFASTGYDFSCLMEKHLGRKIAQPSLRPFDHLWCVWSLRLTDVCFFDMANVSWFIAPGLLSLYWLTSEFVTLWHYSRIDRKTAEKGLSRNKIIDIRLSQIGSHVILLTVFCVFYYRCCGFLM